VRFEKWQALGNDYVIVEAGSLPWELTRRACGGSAIRHFGVGSDGVLLLSRGDDPEFVAELRIFNPDGSEAELSGNGAREAILYLRRHGWTDEDTFSIAPRPDRSRRRSPRADLHGGDGAGGDRLQGLPVGASDGKGTARPAAASGSSSTSRSATRSARSCWR
jgi:diaminopimelate epimerase